jgi:hypothetical protein
VNLLAELANHQNKYGAEIFNPSHSLRRQRLRHQRIPRAGRSPKAWSNHGTARRICDPKHMDAAGIGFGTPKGREWLWCQR